MGGKAGNVILPLLAIGTGGWAASSLGLLGGTAGAATTTTIMGANVPSGLTAATSSGLLGSLSSSQALGLGLSGASSLLSGLSAAHQLQAQENTLQLQKARDAVNLAEQERESQHRLSQTLASQNNFFAATGTAASEGSALMAAQAAKRAGDKELSLYAAQRSLNQYRTPPTSKKTIAARSLLNFGTRAYGILS